MPLFSKKYSFESKKPRRSGVRKDAHTEKAIVTVKTNGKEYSFVGKIINDSNTQKLIVDKAIKTTTAKSNTDLLHIKVCKKRPVKTRTPAKGRPHRITLSNSPDIYVSNDKRVIDSIYSTIRNGNPVRFDDYKVRHTYTSSRRRVVLEFGGGEDVVGGDKPIDPED